MGPGAVHPADSLGLGQHCPSPYKVRLRPHVARTLRLRHLTEVRASLQKNPQVCGAKGAYSPYQTRTPLDGGLWVASSARRTLVSVLVALGVPLAAAAWWRDLVAGHPVVALLLASGWLLFLGTWTVVRRATAEPAERRLKQAGNALDRAVGRRVSGYGRRYRHWVLDSRRYIDVKGLATAGDHTPQLDEVYVDVALTRRAPHQVSGDPLSDVPENATERYSIGKFLDRDEPVVLAIVGPPGCGKSPLLVHVARRSAGATGPGRGVRGATHTG